MTLLPTQYNEEELKNLILFMSYEHYSLIDNVMLARLRLWSDPIRVNKELKQHQLNAGLDGRKTEATPRSRIRDISNVRAWE